MKAKLLLLIALCLPGLSAAQDVDKQKVANKSTAVARKSRHASHVKLIYCDLHACKDEKPHLMGTASFYGRHYWQGRRMANGNRFDYRKLTAASWGIPLGTMVRVTNLYNGKSVVVEITDRGPAHLLHRVVDLSQAAAEILEYAGDGLTIVLIQTIFEPEPEPSVIEAVLDEPALDNAIPSAD